MGGAGRLLGIAVVCGLPGSGLRAGAGRRIVLAIMGRGHSETRRPQGLTSAPARTHFVSLESLLRGRAPLHGPLADVAARAGEQRSQADLRFGCIDSVAARQRGLGAVETRSQS